MFGAGWPRLCSAAKDAYAQMDRLAASVPPGIARCHGPLWTASDGRFGSWHEARGDSLPHSNYNGRPDSGSDQSKPLLSRLRTRSGQTSNSWSGSQASPRVHIALGGGLSRLSTFRQILPQVLGRPISMSRQPDTTVIGSAMIARTAIGEFDSLTEPAIMLSRRAKTMEPDPAEAAEYQDHYEQWLEVHESIGPLLG